jgi:hypothetical protein
MPDAPPMCECYDTLAMHGSYYIEAKLTHGLLRGLILIVWFLVGWPFSNAFVLSSETNQFLSLDCSGAGGILGA